MKNSKGYEKQLPPAIIAADKCNIKLLDALVKSPADLQYDTQVNKSVFTVLFEFSSLPYCKELILKWLKTFGNNLNIDPPHNINIDGVVHWTCQIGDPEIANLMMKTENIKLDRIDKNNKIGPYYLTTNNKISDDDIIKILDILYDNDYNFNYRPEFSDRETTLEVFINSSKKLRLKVIEFLISKNANPFMKMSNKKVSIYEFAKGINNNKKLMEILNQVSEDDFKTIKS